MQKVTSRNYSLTRIVTLLLVIAGWIAFGLIALSSNFGDELENFTASWLVFQGLVPYKDFFFHHAPGPYFWAAPLYWLSSEPWQYFRWLVFFWYLICGTVSWFVVADKLKLVVAFIWILVAVSAPFWKIQMYLAESLMTLSLLTIVVSLFSCYWHKRPKIKVVWLIWIVGGWVAIWSSIVAIPVVLWLGLALTFISGKQLKIVRTQLHRHQKTVFTFSLLLFFLHGGLIAYFLFHQTIAQAWWSVVTYNFQYYFPLRLAGTNVGGQMGYLPSTLIDFIEYTVTNIFDLLTATVIFCQTIVGSFKHSITQPSDLPHLLNVAFSTFAEKILTFKIISSLGLFIPMIFLALQKKWIPLIWWVIFGILLLTRTNEIFKFSPFFLISCSIALLFFISITNKWRIVFVSSWIIIWIALVFPAYKTAFSAPVSLIPKQTSDLAQEISQELEGYQGPIFNFGGNPGYYVLVQRQPAYVYFYYHPWFHGTPQMRNGVKSFVSSNRTAPIMIESEVDQRATLDYAPEINDIIQKQYEKKGGQLYWPKKTVDGNY